MLNFLTECNQNAVSQQLMSMRLYRQLVKVKRLKNDAGSSSSNEISAAAKKSNKILGSSRLAELY